MFIQSFWLPAQPFPNYLISNTNNPNEVSIAMHPADTNLLVLGANTQKIFVSHNSGVTWTQVPVTSSYGIWGDPVLLCDTAGNFLYFHLAKNDTIFVWPNWCDRIVCQRSGNGIAWSNGSFTGLNLPKMQDKQWASVNANTNEIALTWTEFDKYGSADPNDSSRILFSKSVDGGITWSAPVRINEFAGDCKDDDETTEGAVPAFGPQNEIYVTWARDSLIYFDRSTDGGLTWLAQDVVVTQQVGGWNYPVSGFSRCNGLPFIQCDLSNGPYRGTIYINFTDHRNGANNPDVFLVKSIDGGMTWSAPVRVNQDLTQRANFMSYFTIDQKTGYLYILYYDRRNHTGDSTDVYLSVSKDGGQTFTDYRINNKPFLPKPNVFMGDYIGLAAIGGVVRPAWTAAELNQTAIYCAALSFETPVHLGVSDDFSVSKLLQIIPNPARDNCQVMFRGYNVRTVNIYDMSGQLLICNTGYQTRENYHYTSMDLRQLSKGIYQVCVEYNTHRSCSKLVLQ
ncbi:MAG: T9SS type A sorting domain-containing protein [Chitinophagales bacterium]|nr:T9SS type A sorting domain-containing protein [Chitinophagales bacterium]MDW8418222.1 T9SS type A sorting domain-containing protein [Chitinophagales bacterium]